MIMNPMFPAAWPDVWRALLRASGFPALLLTGIGLAVLLSQPPAPVPADAPADTYSATRAMQHVQALAAAPRPIGSDAHDTARDYLLAELAALGMETELQSTTVTYLRATRPGISRFAFVENVIGRWPGTNGEKSLVLMAHYDSRPLTPGAGDDASGVAALLETFRALQDEQPFRNDVIVVLTDGEESGLFGAQAFFREHRWRDTIGMVINTEARGSKGPALLFQTSKGNDQLVRTFAGASLAPSGDSLADAIYRRMPNDTDFSIALENGHQGLNFAYIDGLFDYHSPTDTPQNLSAASVQHLGDHLLPLSRILANAELPLTADADRIFFNTFGRSGFVHYPAVVDQVVLLIAVALLLAFSVRAYQRQEISTAALLRAVPGMLVLLLVPLFVTASVFNAFAGTTRELMASMTAWYAASLLVTVGSFLWLASRLSAGLSPFAASIVAIACLAGLNTLGLPIWLAGLVAVGIGALAAFTLQAAISTTALRSLILLVFILLAAVLIISEPAGAYLFTWPVLLATLVTGIRVLTQDETSWLYRTAIAIPVVLAYGGLSYAMHLALGYSMPLVSMLPIALLASWCLVLFMPGAITERGIAKLLLVIALLIFPWLALHSPFDTRTPFANEIFAITEPDNQAAHLATHDEQLTAWQAGIFTSATRRELPAAWQAGWPRKHTELLLQPTAFNSPGKLVISDVEFSNEDEERRVEFRLRANGPLARGYLQFAKGEHIRMAHVDNQPIARPHFGDGESWRWSWVGLPDDGVRIELLLAGDANVSEISSVTIADGLPAALRLPPRPDAEVPAPYSWSDSTLVVQQLNIATGGSDE
jgi:hypothetical protein